MMSKSNICIDTALMFLSDSSYDPPTSIEQSQPFGGMPQFSEAPVLDTHGQTNTEKKSMAQLLIERRNKGIMGKRRRKVLPCLRCLNHNLRCTQTEIRPCARCRWDKVECIPQDSYCTRFSSDMTCSERTNARMRPSEMTPNNILYNFGLKLDEPTHDLQLPAFVKPPPPSMAQEEVTYLHTYDAWSLPPLPARNVLLYAYVNYVHPFMPLLELRNFFHHIDSDINVVGQISLLLYHAVMFAAASFVDEEVLYSIGYPTRKAAKQALFRKTRLLYEFDYESDRLVIVQSLLLMTYWQKEPEDNKDMRHWLGIAISLAQTIGLHRDPTALGLSSRLEKIRKRIWWCCIMRDCLIALGMRQPTHIKGEFEVPMLQASDFDFEIFPADHNIISEECAFLRDISIQQELAALCVCKSQLCICINQVIATQHLFVPQDEGRSRKLDGFESIISVDMQLKSWNDSLPSVCQYRPLTALDVGSGRGVVAVHRTQLHMLYFTTILALHRPQFLSCRTHESTIPFQIQELAKTSVKNATMHITQMATQLAEHGLDKYLPPTGVTAILLAMVTSLLEMKDTNEIARDNGRRSFFKCMHVLETLRGIYDSANWATVFLYDALTKADYDFNTLSEPTNEILRVTNPLERTPSRSSMKVGKTPVNASLAVTSEFLQPADFSAQDAAVLTTDDTTEDMVWSTVDEADFDEWLQRL